jgi:lysophospholipase
MNLISRLTLLCSAALMIGDAFAIPEENYAQEYAARVRPFLVSGERLGFTGEAGVELSGVWYQHPSSRGTIVVVPGRSESWLKYGEVFFDLYEKGYSLFSYDHRGQGLSEHFVGKNPQIGHIDSFANYTRDLDRFLKEIVLPRTPSEEKLFLLAHSMGGAIAADHLANPASPFRAAILSAPMLQINTSPYPEAVACAIAGGAVLVGKGAEYAPGKSDRDPNEPFETNEVTHSLARFQMGNEVVAAYPEIALGGPSNRWVSESVKATHRIRKAMSGITVPVLLFQAGHDTLVKPGGQDSGCGRAKACVRLLFAEAKHEILMETDLIRDRAMALVDQFFSETR